MRGKKNFVFAKLVTNVSHVLLFIGLNGFKGANRHMGPLKSMKYGSLLKAIYKFSMVHQNYGK
ncbi:hypothetical protein CK203_010695 [Vitis vinifera]|uniref:Uncharacterized protein n=1 Tax=Vitis vinifera TaxID=29760 RepID=A0A438JTN3_VITVI|nr:hypothetical protein CK203_010695 [Vitis vinifera]